MSATNRGAERNPRDFYATPRSAFIPLMDYLPKNLPFCDPACGDGRLVRWLRESDRSAVGADIVPQDKTFATLDFLADQSPKRFIITNPPFSLAQEFITHALRLAPEVIMLLRLNFLGAQCRRDWWRCYEPNSIFVLSERPKFIVGKSGDSCEYGWFYWGRRYSGIKHL